MDEPAYSSTGPGPAPVVVPSKGPRQEEPWDVGPSNPQGRDAEVVRVLTDLRDEHGVLRLPPR
ncbi:hypothetical protein GCM10010330_65480 [Streptomyces tendae]|nr:hypothetical protein GCM10010330_65480 [Streptomyces tendae]